jgi:L-lactate utilization protein LutB
MNTSSYKDYLVDCKKAIDKDKRIDVSYQTLKDISSSVFRNFDKVKKLASNIRYKFINNIDDNLIIFDKNFSENGGNIHWCIAYDDFLDKLEKLLNRKDIKKVNIFDSMFVRELDVDGSLQQRGIKNDSEDNNCIVFSPMEGIVNTGSLFLNFNSAYDMELVLGSKIKIFVLPINDFLFKLEDIEIFSHLYSIYKDGIDYPYLTSIYTPSPIEKENNVHLFIIDNGRSNILENKDISQALTCIGCDACKKVCPVYNVIGEEPYNNIFSGPIANVILPFTENIENFKHLCFSACTLCGNCSKVCPVNIPISELIIANKHYFFENKLMDMQDGRIVKTLHKVLSSRGKMNSKKWIKEFKIKILLNNSNISNKYTFSKSTFNQQYQVKNNASNQN